MCVVSSVLARYFRDSAKATSLGNWKRTSAKSSSAGVTLRNFAPGCVPSEATFTGHRAKMSTGRVRPDISTMTSLKVCPLIVSMQSGLPWHAMSVHNMLASVRTHLYKSSLSGALHAYACTHTVLTPGPLSGSRPPCVHDAKRSPSPHHPKRCSSCLASVLCQLRCVGPSHPRAVDMSLCGQHAQLDCARVVAVAVGVAQFAIHRWTTSRTPPLRPTSAKSLTSLARSETSTSQGEPLRRHARARARPLSSFVSSSCSG